MWRLKDKIGCDLCCPQVKVSQQNSVNDEQVTVKTLSKGDWFGEQALKGWSICRNYKNSPRIVLNHSLFNILYVLILISHLQGFFSREPQGLFKWPMFMFPRQGPLEQYIPLVIAPKKQCTNCTDVTHKLASNGHTDCKCGITNYALPVGRST